MRCRSRWTSWRRRSPGNGPRWARCWRAPVTEGSTVEASRCASESCGEAHGQRMPTHRIVEFRLMIGDPDVSPTLMSVGLGRVSFLRCVRRPVTT